MLCPNDRVVVLVADDRFEGVLTSPHDVEAFMAGHSFGVLRYRDDGSHVVLPRRPLPLPGGSAADDRGRRHVRNRHVRGSRSARSRVADSRTHRADAPARTAVQADALGSGSDTGTPFSASTAASDPPASALPSGAATSVCGLDDDSCFHADPPSDAAVSGITAPGSGIAPTSASNAAHVQLTTTWGRLPPLVIAGATGAGVEGGALATPEVLQRLYLPGMSAAMHHHAQRGGGLATALANPSMPPGIGVAAAANPTMQVGGTGIGPMEHRFEQQSRRSRSAPASRGPSLTPKRRVSGAGNEKLRRVVHRLALIKRFNAAQQAALASAAAKGDLAGTNSGSSNSTSSMRSNGSIGSYMSSKGSVARWGHRRRLERTMNNYVREQVSSSNKQNPRDGSTRCAAVYMQPMRVLLRAPAAE